MKKFILTLVISFLITSGTASAKVGTLMSDNLAWTWWTHPIAIQSGADMYYGGVNNKGDWRVFKNSKSDSTIIYNGLEPDDHNAPSTLARPGKKVLSFFTRHGRSQFVNHTFSNEGTMSFASKQKITYSNNVTYSQLLNYENGVIQLSRNDRGKWDFVRSVDNGANWSDPTAFLDLMETGKIYMTTSPSQTYPGSYNFAAYGHPTESTFRNILYGRISMVTGDVTKSDGTVLANVFTGSNLPLHKEDLEVAWTPTGAHKPKVRLLDVSDKNGKPIITYAKWNDVTSTPQYYYGYLNRTWIHAKIASSGGVFGESQPKKYVGGIAFDRNNRDEAYVSLKQNGIWKINRYVINSNMKFTYQKTVASSTLPLVRPYTPIDGSGVLYQQLQRYKGYKSYSSYVYWSL